MIQKTGGGRVIDHGPMAPHGSVNYSIGGRSVHSADASSGISKSTIKDTRIHTRKPGAVRGQPISIKRRMPNV